MSEGVVKKKFDPDVEVVLDGFIGKRSRQEEL